MPAIYEGLDLRCAYPDNWTVSEEQFDENVQGFNIESPDAAFFSLVRYPWNCAPREVLEKAVPALESEYEQFETTTIEPGLGIDDSRAIEANFYCLDFLVTARLIAFTVRPHTYLVQMQAEDREFEKLELVFRAMLKTILESLGRDFPEQ